jgi:MraZ protein
MGFAPEDLVFSGHSRHSIDEKGRVAIPKSFRKVLPSESIGRFKLCVGHDNTIEIHPLPEWKRLEMATLADLDRDVHEDRERLEAKLWFSEDAEMDQANRILIPRYLLNYAGLESNSECVFTGMGRYFALLSAAKFDERMQRYLRNFSKYTEKPKPGGTGTTTPEGKSGTSSAEK